MREHVSRVAQACFSPAPSTLCSSTTRPRRFCATGLGPSASHLDYCNAVLVGLPAATLAPLQRVLRAAARLVLDLKPRDHVQRIDYKLCLLVHKALIGQAPDYITNLLTLVTNIPSRSSLRASSNFDLFQRRTERRIGDRAFSIATPRAWNRLPTELKLMRSSTATFRSNLKYFLFRTAY